MRVKEGGAGTVKETVRFEECDDTDFLERVKGYGIYDIRFDGY